MKNFCDPAYDTILKRDVLKDNVRGIEETSRSDSFVGLNSKINNLEKQVEYLEDRISFFTKSIDLQPEESYPSKGEEPSSPIRESILNASNRITNISHKIESITKRIDIE